MWTGWKYTGRRSTAATVLVGAISGAMMATTSVGGPPVLLYLLSGNDPPRGQPRQHRHLLFPDAVPADRDRAGDRRGGRSMRWSVRSCCSRSWRWAPGPAGGCSTAWPASGSTATWRWRCCSGPACSASCGTGCWAETAAHSCMMAVIHWRPPCASSPRILPPLVLTLACRCRPGAPTIS